MEITCSTNASTSAAAAAAAPSGRRRPPASRQLLQCFVTSAAVRGLRHPGLELGTPAYMGIAMGLVV